MKVVNFSYESTSGGVKLEFVQYLFDLVRKSIDSKGQKVFKKFDDNHITKRTILRQQKLSTNQN